MELSLSAESRYRSTQLFSRQLVLALLGIFWQTLVFRVASAAEEIPNGGVVRMKWLDDPEDTHYHCGSPYSEDDEYFADYYPNRNCGLSPNDPCIASMFGVTEEIKDNCNLCYKLVMARDDVVGDNCAGSVCPAYSKEIFVQVVEKYYMHYTPAMFQVSALGWIELCPFTCRISDNPWEMNIATDTCVLQSSSCTWGSTESNGYFPGSLAGTIEVVKPMSFVETNCETGKEIGDWENAFTTTAAPTTPAPGETTTTRPVDIDTGAAATRITARWTVTFAAAVATASIYLCQ